MLSGNSREVWDSYLVPDPRASNLWDEKRLVSRRRDIHRKVDQGVEILVPRLL